MKVPFLDLRLINSHYRDQFGDSLGRVLDNGQLILGEEVGLFEKEFSGFLRVNGCAGVGSGLDALEIAMRALGIGPGDEVIVPGFTFIATWIAVSRTGARVIPVDCIYDDCNIDPEKIDASITVNTKAIITVHLYGQCCDMDKINALAKRRNIMVIEDAAQAHGATYKGKMAGKLASCAAFSFYPGKVLGALGDAGCITSDDPELIEMIKMIRNYGSSEKYIHDVCGANSRLDSVQAAFLRVKMRTLESDLVERRRVADFYLSHIDNRAVSKPVTRGVNYDSWHLFVIKSKSRSLLQEHLAMKGIETLIHYPISPHQQKCYSQLDLDTSLSVSESLSREVLSLPIYPGMTEEQCSRVVEAVNSFTA